MARQKRTRELEEDQVDSEWRVVAVLEVIVRHPGSGRVGGEGVKWTMGGLGGR